MYDVIASPIARYFYRSRRCMRLAHTQPHLDCDRTRTRQLVNWMMQDQLVCCFFFVVVFIYFYATFAIRVRSCCSVRTYFVYIDWSIRALVYNVIINLSAFNMLPKIALRQRIFHYGNFLFNSHSIWNSFFLCRLFSALCAFLLLIFFCLPQAQNKNL